MRSSTVACTLARVAPVASARVSAVRSTAAEHEQRTSSPPGRTARHAFSASFVYARSACSRAPRVGASRGGSAMTRSNDPRASASARRASSFTNVTRSPTPFIAAHSRADLDRRGALVDGDDLARPAARRGDREGAHEGVRVEHALAARELLDARAERALVEVEARSSGRARAGCESAGRARRTRAPRGSRPGRRRRRGSKPSILAVCVARSVDDGPRREDRRERLEDQRLAPLHADGPELDREHVPVAVDDEPGQPVALGVNEAQAGRVVARQSERRAQRQGSLEARAKERRVDLRRGVANEEAHRDRRSRRVEAAAEEVAARIDDAHLVARCRTSVDCVDRLRVDPGMPRPDGLHVTGLEANRRHAGERVIGPAAHGVDDYCVATPGP